MHFITYSYGSKRKYFNRTEKKKKITKLKFDISMPQ